MCAAGSPLVGGHPLVGNRHDFGDGPACTSRHAELLPIVQAAIAAELKAAGRMLGKKCALHGHCDNDPRDPVKCGWCDAKDEVIARIQPSAQSALEGMLREAESAGASEGK